MVFHSTVLFVKDIGASKKFYTLFLDFYVEHDFGKNIIMSNGLSLWEISPGHIINKQLDTTIGSNRFELYFETENLEEISGKLKTGGVKFLHPINEETWGQRTVRFFDPDDHLIEIGEPMVVFVNNMHKKGLTPVQISARSGIPIEKVVGLIWK